MAEPLAYRNGQFLPFSELSISVADAGFVFGATVSEFVRTFGGKLFRLDDHIARLRQSCELCRIPLCVTDQELRVAADKVAQCNLARTQESKRRSLFPPGRPAGINPAARSLGKSDELALIIFATPGPLPYLGGADTGPTVAMHTFPLPIARYRHLFTDGAKLIVPSIRHDSTVDPRAKMRSRMNWWIAEQEVRQIDPDAWALLTSHDNVVTETAAANFLFVRDGTVFSPPGNAILNGVSLHVVKELCDELHIPFVERPIQLKESLKADEAMLTGTAFCVCGVSSINRVAIPWPGPIFQRITQRWSQRFGWDFVGQFLN